MAELLSESQKNLESDQNRQEALTEQLQLMQRDIRKNILRNENDVAQIEKDTH